MFQTPMPDPLIAYHNYLRLGAPSGYPNQQYGAPHSYAMAMAHQQYPRSLQSWRYDQGRNMRQPQSQYNQMRPRQTMGRKMSLYTQQRNRLNPMKNNDAASWGTPHQYHPSGMGAYTWSRQYGTQPPTYPLYS